MNLVDAAGKQLSAMGAPVWDAYKQAELVGRPPLLATPTVCFLNFFLFFCNFKWFFSKCLKFVFRNRVRKWNQLLLMYESITFLFCFAIMIWIVSLFFKTIVTIVSTTWRCTCWTSDCWWREMEMQSNSWFKTQNNFKIIINFFFFTNNRRVHTKTMTLQHRVLSVRRRDQLKTGRWRAKRASNSASCKKFVQLRQNLFFFIVSIHLIIGSTRSSTIASRGSWCQTTTWIGRQTRTWTGLFSIFESKI